jgi:hypothetical protein
MKTDSLKLVDMLALDEEITSCSPLRRAWGDEEIFLDYWGLYEQVFGGRPQGSVSGRELLQPEGEGNFLLLRSEHVGEILKSLRGHIDELSVMTEEQLATLEKWQSLSLANHRHMVAYIFNRGSNAQPDEGPKVPRAEANEAKRPEVKTRNLQFVAVVLLGLFMVPLGSLLVVAELSKGSGPRPAALMIGFATLLMYAVVAWLFRRAYVRSVKYFSDEGLVLNGGRSLAWADLSRVVDRIRLNRVTGVKFIWRTEIHFRNGESAWLLPTKISNFTEVYEFVRGLSCEYAEVRV